MDFFQAIILGVVEGITEFLPISSTGHLVLASDLLNISQTDFVKTFEISIQLGAILAVVFLYGKKLLVDREILKRIIWVFIPTGALGFLLYKLIKEFLIGNMLVTISALFLGGILILILENYFSKNIGKKEIKDLSLKESLSLGVIQTLSVIPGVSRSGTTIFGGMFLGLKREAATELSFMVAIPVMFAATGLDLIKSFKNFNSNGIEVLILGMIVSFIVSIGVIKWLLGFVKTHDLKIFGVYRIVIAIIFLLKDI